MKKKQKAISQAKPAPARDTQERKPAPDGLAYREAIEEIQIRIDLIQRDFGNDPGMMRYREALIYAVASMKREAGL